MWINTSGNIYEGDCLPGDRSATQQEVTDWFAAIALEKVATVSALNGLLAINQAGLAASYEAWATDPARTFAQRAFIDKAQNWRRDDATLIAAATALGLTSEQVDNMFILAATL